MTEASETKKKRKPYNPHGGGHLKIRKKMFWAKWTYHGKTYERSTGIRIDMVNSKGNPCGREMAMKVMAGYLQPFQLDQEADVLSVISSRVERSREGAEKSRANLDGTANVRLQDLAEMYKNSPRRNDITEQHLKGNMAIINEFSSWLGGDRLASSVLPREAAKWAEGIWSSGVTANTYNSKVATLRHAWSILMPSMESKDNPFIGIKKKKDDAKLKRGITEEEYARILEVAGDRYGGDLKMMVVIGWNTGLRIGDCAKLTWKDIDFDSGFIRVTTQKTGQKVSIPMLPEFKEILRQHKSDQEMEFEKARRIGWDDYWAGRLAPTEKDRDANAADERYIGFVCPRMAERQERERTLLNQLMKKTFTKAGIKTSADVKGDSKVRGVRSRPMATFHSLRHGLASRLALSGVPELVAKELLGHRSDIVHEHYVHVHEDYLKMEMAKMQSSNAPK